eukprot:GHVT01027815.1.p1 GENE.GHVT01027815.1~~GHVT01027815.1.p1  ORF type:complete len:182 (+),score=26.31 GHVT01027815.1:460-1005(+)
MRACATSTAFLPPFPAILPRVVLRSCVRLSAPSATQAKNGRPFAADLRLSSRRQRGEADSLRRQAAHDLVAGRTRGLPCGQRIGNLAAFAENLGRKKNQKLKDKLLHLCDSTAWASSIWEGWTNERGDKADADSRAELLAGLPCGRVHNSGTRAPSPVQELRPCEARGCPSVKPRSTVARH